MTTFETINTCRVCGSERLTPILSLGDHPLANALKKRPDQEEPRYPLTLLFCSDCSLSQIKETINKELLFNNYVWVTGTSSAAQRFAYTFFHHISQITLLEKSDLVVEIASNDGTFLKPFIENGFNGIGVDPAKNIADIANGKGIRTLHAFWNEEVAKNIVTEYGNAKLVFGRNVIAHVSELHNVVSGINLCLADEGIGAIEFHYAGNILEQLQYDAIYHEHLCYFSMKSFQFLLGQHKLHPFHAELSPISGGAYIVYFGKQRERQTEAYSMLVERENRLSVNALPSWKSFAVCCDDHREQSRKIVGTFSKKSRVGFGASARSSTYLNFCRFTDSDIDAIIDNNDLKQGLYTPGSSIGIVTLEQGLARKPEVIFVLAWNFKEEIVRECRKRGYTGTFLLPFPNEPHCIK